ncbi:MAG TPA: glycosyltransferase family 1 protein [Acidimicrobiales bacterium]|nr:glycosyltransferase family 1 protein [Acidimicrobiales bacterium]
MASVEPVDVPLVLAGRADTGAGQVRSEIERLGLEKRVRLAGFVTDDTLPALLQGATALLHPSADEGFGIPPLEAMAAGTPVVAARAGALPEIVANAGLLVDAHDAVGWASAISDVASNLELRLRLRATGRARAAGFTWDKVARETWALHRRQLG